MTTAIMDQNFQRKQRKIIETNKQHYASLTDSIDKRLNEDLDHDLQLMEIINSQSLTETQIV